MQFILSSVVVAFLHIFPRNFKHDYYETIARNIGVYLPIIHFIDNQDIFHPYNGITNKNQIGKQ